jgi:hypothetical protein
MIVRLARPRRDRFAVPMKNFRKILTLYYAISLNSAYTNNQLKIRSVERIS